MTRRLELALGEIVKLKAVVAKLQARLAVYDNPNTPSSKQRFPDRRREEPRGPLGRPPGFVGCTRPAPKPDRVINVRPERCKCGSKRIRVSREFSKVVEDVEIKRVVTDFRFYECRCLDCGRVFETTHEDLPREGVFGPTLLSLWNALHYEGAVPFKRLAEFSEKSLGVPIMPAGVMEAVYRSAHVFQPFYDDVNESLASADYVRSDETSYSYCGEKHWLWNFSNHDVSLVKLVDSRASTVPKQVLGSKFAGVLNTDCYPAYDSVKAGGKQKCWAHLLREAKRLSEESEEGKAFYGKLKRMHAYVKKVKEKHEEGSLKTERWTKRTVNKIHEWTEHRWHHDGIRKLVKRIARYEQEWFTCLKHDFVETTNNTSEREVRKNVIARKISGLHRSKRGAHSREIIMIVLLTTPKKGMNAYDFILQ